MSTPPSMRANAPTAQPSGQSQVQEMRTKTPIRPPLSKRLPSMSDKRLLSLQRAAMQISIDPEHPKRASATAALPLIDAEIGRRAAGLEAGAPARGDAGNADV